MKKTTKKTSKSIKISRPSTKKLEVNNLGVGAYVGLSLAVYVCVYFFLTNALRVVIPSFMVETMWSQAQLTLTAILLTTFMSFGVIMFLTKSTLHRVIKVGGICVMASGFVYLYSLLYTLLNQV